MAGSVKPLSKQELQSLAAGYQKFHATQQQQQYQKRSGLQKWAPAIGATATGLAAAPFTGGLSLVGTLAALGTAGAVGGAVGERAAQQTNREDINWKRIKDQAIAGGVTSAIPIGGVARSAKVASSLAENAAATGTEQAVGKGVLGKIANSGRRLETRAGGYGIGNTKTGSPPIDIFNQRKIQATLKSEGIKPGHPEDLAINAQTRLKNYHGQMDKVLSQNNITFKPKEVGNIQKEYLSKVNSSATVDNNIRKYANQFASNLKNVKSLKDLNNFRRELDQKAISWIANPDATTSAKTEAARTLREHLSSIIGKKAPALKEVNTKYSNLSHANDYLTKESGVLTKQSQNAGAGLTGRVLTGDLASTVKSKVGASMQKVGGGSGATAIPSGTRTAGTELGKQQLASTILGITQAGKNQPQPNPNDVNQPPVEDPTQVAQDPTQQQDQQQQQEAPAYSLDQALLDAQRDPKHADTYLSFAKAYEASNKSSSKNGAHGIVSAQSYSNALSGQQSLAQLQQLISQNPGLTSKTSIPGQGAPVIGGYVQKALGTNEYKALAHNVADAVLRLRTGAQANESEIRLYMTQFMPQAGDPPATVQRKLQILASNFTPYLSQGGPTDLSSLTSALTAAQGGY